MTALPNPFLNSAPARTSPGADDAAAMRPPPVPAAADFPNPTMPTVGSAVASKAPPVADATAAPIPCVGVGGHANDTTGSHGFQVRIDPGAQDIEPSMTNGGDQEAPAGSAPNTAAPAGALGDRLDWHEFWNAITDERIILFEPFDEHPLFVIEDGSLQRLEA